MSKSPLILASQSPRRAQLLREAGIEVEVVSPKYGEPDPETWPHSPTEMVEAISYFKAASIAEDFPDRIILGADTTVASADGRIFGKADDADHARRILARLMGTTHEVITGVALLQPAASRRVIQHEVTQVTMKRLTPAELDAYIADGQWQGKAGAYGIQDADDPFVERIQGSFSNVVGLPIELVMILLDKFGK